MPFIISQPGTARTSWTVLLNINIYYNSRALYSHVTITLLLIQRRADMMEVKMKVRYQLQHCLTHFFAKDIHFSVGFLKLHIVLFLRYM